MPEIWGPPVLAFTVTEVIKVIKLLFDRSSIGGFTPPGNVSGGRIRDVDMRACP